MPENHSPPPSTTKNGRKPEEKFCSHPLMCHHLANTLL